MKTGALLIALLILATSICAVSAEEEISLSVTRQEFIFPLTGEEARIPVTITNVYDEDISGTLTVRIYDSPEAGSTSNYQEKVMNAFSGDSIIYVSAGIADEAKIIVMDIAFEYGNSPTYSSALKGIVVNFTDSGDAAIQESDIDKIISESEIKPAATSTSPATSGSAYDSPDTLAEESIDSAALQRTLLAEQIEEEFIRQQLVSIVLNDGLFAAENNTFSDLNYSISKIYTAGTDYENGSFSCNFHTADRDIEVMVTGIIKNGEIVNIIEEINNSIFLPAEFNENATLKEMLESLDSDGFIPVETNLNISQNEKKLEISLMRGVYNASIFAEYKNGTITSLEMERDKFLPFYVIPLIVMILALVNAAALYMYYSAKTEDEDGDVLAEANTPDLKLSALAMLDKAEELFREGERKEAVCSAAKTFRDWMSWQFFREDEVSDDICIEFLVQIEEEGEKAAGVLKSTESARYGDEPLSEEEFTDMINTIRRFILMRSRDDN